MAKAIAHSYGKDAVSVYRIAGDTLFACEARVIVRGEAFEESYTEGDNSMVVATDSMKNFLHAMGHEYEGDTLEGFVELFVRDCEDSRCSSRARCRRRCVQSSFRMETI